MSRTNIIACVSLRGERSVWEEEYRQGSDGNADADVRPGVAGDTDGALVLEVVLDEWHGAW